MEDSVMRTIRWIPAVFLLLVSLAAVPAAYADDPPTALFYVVCVGRTCSVDAESSTDDGGIVNYHWAWGDGQTTSGGSPQSAPSHTYAANGSYTITLTVKDAANQTDTESHGVTVDLAPEAFYKLICDGRTCHVDGSGSTDDVGVTSYLWNWGDEQVTLTTGPTASHTYEYDDTFTIVLTAYDTRGNTNTFARLANTLDNPPAVNFWVVCVSRTCSVDAESSGDDGFITNYHWNWGDGATTNGTDTDPSHTYAAAGTYRITLTLTDNASQTNSDRITVTVP
jgi:PKD repeat protein